MWIENIDVTYTLDSTLSPIDSIIIFLRTLKLFRMPSKNCLGNDLGDLPTSLDTTGLPLRF